MKSTRRRRARASAMKRASHPSPGACGAGEPSLSPVLSSLGHSAAARIGVMFDWADESGSLNPSRSRARPERLTALNLVIEAGVREPAPHTIGTHTGPPLRGGGADDQL